MKTAEQNASLTTKSVLAAANYLHGYPRPIPVIGRSPSIDVPLIARLRPKPESRFPIPVQKVIHLMSRAVKLRPNRGNPLRP